MKTVWLLLVYCVVLWAGDQNGSSDQDAGDPSLTVQRQSGLWQALLKHEPSWFASPAALRMADYVLLFQRAGGGWPKEMDRFASLSEAAQKELREQTERPPATIDNGATWTQLYFLARMIEHSRDQRYVAAFNKGLDYLLAAQYANGGWPQFYPLRKGYYSLITYNDDAMAGVLQLLQDVITDTSRFRFVDAERRSKSATALQKGIDCILRTQVRDHGRLTAWCAQHDETTLQPANARAYELASLSGHETVGLVAFLMRIKNPSPAILAAVQNAVAWLDQVKITGIRVVQVKDEKSPTGFNKVVIQDPHAPPIWARFYDIGTNRPFFSDRDGKKYFNLSDISYERRNEYGWLGYWPAKLLKRTYPEWQQKWVPHENVLSPAQGKR